MFPLGSFPVYKCDARLTILIFNELIITNSEEQTSRSERVKFFRSFHSFIHTYIHILIYYYYYYNSWHHPFQRPSPWTDSEIIIYTIGLPYRHPTTVKKNCFTDATLHLIAPPPKHNSNVLYIIYLFLIRKN